MLHKGHCKHCQAVEVKGWFRYKAAIRRYKRQGHIVWQVTKQDDGNREIVLSVAKYPVDAPIHTTYKTVMR